MSNDGRGDAAHLLLDNQLCFSLHAAGRAIRKAYAEVLGPAGVTYPQYLVLISLLENDGLTIGELGRLLALDSGTLTPLVKRLEDQGQVRRRRGARDERRVEVWLTDLGRAQEPVLRRARSHVVEKLRMDDGEIADLRAVLMSIAGRLGPGSADRA